MAQPRGLCPDEKKFYGTTAIGEKGQVVVPIEARKKMQLKKGENLLVFGFGEGMIALVKLSQVEDIAKHLSDKLRIIGEVIQKTKKK